MLSAGIDVGTRTLNICISENDKIIASVSASMEKDFRGLLKTTMGSALGEAGRARGRKTSPRHISETVATGYGGHLVKKADKRLSDGVCLARGAYSLVPGINRVVSVGGLFIRSVIFDEEGFLLEEQENERCAAGSGRFLEMVASSLQVSYDDVSRIAGESVSPVTGQNSCAVFAESEIISFVNSGYLPADILAGVIHSIAAKTATVIERLGGEGPLLLTGGVARVDSFPTLLAEMTGEEILLPPCDPEFVAVRGAALVAGGNFVRSRRKKVTPAV